MPFPDELRDGVVVVEYRPDWPVRFERLAGQLREALGVLARQVDHIGSTSVPALPAKDCIDVQVRVESIEETRLVSLLGADYLRADKPARRAWGAFKQRLALSVPDLMDYGQVEAPATNALLAGAERWAVQTGWPGL